jgi:uncharacterized protein HemY
MRQEPEKITINLTKVHLMLATAVLIISMLTPFITGFITISKNTEAIGRHDERITILEAGRLDNRELLQEIRFNLKKHMEQAGEKYIDWEESTK